jgi:hypothetical protein
VGLASGGLAIGLMGKLLKKIRWRRHHFCFPKPGTALRAPFWHFLRRR